jgi:hypothetical protein
MMVDDTLNYWVFGLFIMMEKVQKPSNSVQQNFGYLVATTEELLNMSPRQWIQKWAVTSEIQKDNPSRR